MEVCGQEMMKLNSGMLSPRRKYRVICYCFYLSPPNFSFIIRVNVFRYLHVSGNTYQHPIPGQFEVSASSSTYGSSWKAAEGIFIQPSNITVKSHEKAHEEL